MTYRPGPIPEPPKDNVWGRELTSRLRMELLAISKSTTSSGVAGVSVSAYGNKTAVSTSGTVVSLKKPLNNYIVLYRCENSAGDLVGVSITNINANTFTATPLENATLHWTPIEV